MDVVVLTPTVGSLTLQQCVNSVREQVTEHFITHLIVRDGPNMRPYPVLTHPKREIKNAELPYRTGVDGYYGHRVYAGFSKMLEGDYVLLLDEDNWFEPEHVHNLVTLCEETGSHFTFSKRKIYDKNGQYICDDDCESLGIEPTWCSNGQEFLVDTSSYCFRMDVFRAYGHFWDHGWGADRRFFNILRSIEGIRYSRHDQPTLSYRLDGNPGSVTRDFFIQGNLARHKRDESYG